MKLLLDTTYLLPAIGISVKEMEIPKDLPLQLIKQGDRLYICDVTIFELAAKGAKHISEDKLPAERVVKGIRAIIYSEEIEAIPAYEDKTLHTAFKLRKPINGFIDCPILSAAMNQCDIPLTEDEDIHKIEGNDIFNELRKTINPSFKIKRAANIKPRTHQTRKVTCQQRRGELSIGGALIDK